MSRNAGIDASVSSKIDEAGSMVPLPDESQVRDMHGGGPGALTAEHPPRGLFSACFWLLLLNVHAMSSKSDYTVGCGFLPAMLPFGLLSQVCPVSRLQTTLASMSEDEWMRRFGSSLRAQLAFDHKHPGWASDPEGWWAQHVRRSPSSGSASKSGQHHSEMDGDPDRDRVAGSLPLHRRADRPLWAERIGTRDPLPAPQSTSIFGHRAEYLPGNSCGPPAMRGRYQPSYQRIAAHELPEHTELPDGRFWLAGVAQGAILDPSQPRAGAVARRKPIELTPDAACVVVDGESHTLGIVFRDLAWTHPDVSLAVYSREHPAYGHVCMRLRMQQGAAVSAEQALAQTLEGVQSVMEVAGKSMEAAMVDVKLPEEFAKRGIRPGPRG